MLKTLTSRLFGGACFLCRGRARDILCERCNADLPRLPQSLCPRCALASPDGAMCGRCLSHPPHFDATIASLAYPSPAAALVHALKFRGELALAPFLAALLLERVPALREVDFVIAVPLSSRGLRQRGTTGRSRSQDRSPLRYARRSSFRCASACATRQRKWSFHGASANATCEVHLP